MSHLNLLSLRCFSCIFESMHNNRFFLLVFFLFLIVADAAAQLFRVELKNRTDLYFIDANKNSLLLFDDSTHYTQIDITTGATKVLPY